MVLGFFSALPCPLNLESLYARGAAASVLKRKEKCVCLETSSRILLLVEGNEFRYNMSSSVFSDVSAAAAPVSFGLA